MYFSKRIKICSPQNLYVNDYSIIFHNSQKQGTTQMAVSWWMDKQNVDTIQQWKETIDTYYNMHEPQKHTKGKKADADDFILYDSVYQKS